MSEIIDKLLSTEKEALEFVKSAEKEAGKRLNTCREKIKQETTKIISSKVVELENTQAKEKKKLIDELEIKKNEYKEKLSKLKINDKELNSYIMNLLTKV